jgi:hypothetical protein
VLVHLADQRYPVRGFRQCAPDYRRRNISRSF